ncbi:unnamed protein product [Scytosiphon promiscuus]
MGQDFFVGGGGSDPTAYMPSEVSTSGEGGGGGRRGGGDTSDSEDEQARRSSSKTNKSSSGSSSSTTKQEAGVGDDEDDEDILIGDSDSSRRKPKSSKLPGMRNQAELVEEEDSSLFFVQLPTKLPRPLPAFQRGRDGGSQSSGGGKGKGKALGGRVVQGNGPVENEHGYEAAPAAGCTEGASMIVYGKRRTCTVVGLGGLRRMRAGKIGKLYVHQSGKARLVIGGVSLVVHPGLPVSFMEQGVSIDAADQRSFCSFGQVTKRAVCTPDFEQLYRRADENSGGGEDGPEGGGPVKMEVS